jgi:hypothetical protein
MDEEFVGGTSLQGLCSNFRGKLCVWAHLMRITVDNSKDLVDQLVPKGSGKAAVEKILFDIEKQVKGQQYTAGEAAQLSKPTSTGRFGTPGRAVSSGKPRSDSTFKGKLAHSMESKGPPEKGVRFTRAGKNAKSGLARWKAIISGKSKGNNASANLKAMLGVSAVTSDKKRTTNSEGSRHPVQDASAGLKAMLGVNASSQPAVPQPAPNSSAGLKALLGIDGGAATPPPPHPSDANFPPPPPPPMPQVLPPPPLTAANKLMQMMAMQQPQMHRGPVPISSSFNFSYVEEGKDAPEPMQPPVPPQFAPQFAPPMPMHMVVTPFGQMPMPPTPNLPVIPPMQAYVQTSGGSATVISDDEFPPLGGPTEPIVKEEEPKKQLANKKQPASLVPSIVRK